MALRLTVARGDSLWGLACRYLGSGERYPQIYEYHNREAARFGVPPIKNKDLIFVGQTILIPPRQKVPQPGSGNKAEGDKLPIALDLKVSYTIGKDTPPVTYATSFGDYTIIIEMSGELAIENTTPGNQKDLNNYELAMSKNSIEAKQKLYSSYDPAFATLMAKPEMAFESGRVVIKAPIATTANLGPYTIKVQAVSPIQMTGTLKPEKVESTLALGKRRYTFSAEIEYKIDVIWKQKPQNRPELVKVDSVKKREELYVEEKSGWDRLVEEKGALQATIYIITGVATIFMYRFMMKGAPLPSSSISPFTHTIDMSNFNA